MLYSPPEFPPEGLRPLVVVWSVAQLSKLPAALSPQNGLERLAERLHSFSRGLLIRLGEDEFGGLLQGWVSFWVLDVQVMDDLGDQYLLTTSFKVTTASAIPRLLPIIADVPIIL